MKTGKRFSTREQDRARSPKKLQLPSFEGKLYGGRPYSRKPEREVNFFQSVNGKLSLIPSCLTAVAISRFLYLAKMQCVFPLTSEFLAEADVSQNTYECEHTR